MGCGVAMRCQEGGWTREKKAEKPSRITKWGICEKKKPYPNTFSSGRDQGTSPKSKRETEQAGGEGHLREIWFSFQWEFQLTLGGKREKREGKGCSPLGTCGPEKRTKEKQKKEQGSL